ncbi:methionyl-tRNA formyltransferase [Chitinophaga sp. S165]|nr:methionyl-tRNA formyltransferase [Chitinophaga sp. S165]
MRIGIISNCDLFIPMAYTLANQGLQVCIFYAPSEDPIVHQKVNGFIQASKLPSRYETNPADDVYDWLKDTQPETVFVCGYRHLLDVTRFSGVPAYNIHPGPLPSFRGPSPAFWQLKTGQPTLGFTIHELSSRFDAGKVVWTRSIANLPQYHYGMVQQLCSQLCVEGVAIILNALRQLAPFPEIAATEGTTGAYHKRPQLKDVLIDWGKMDALEICNLIRACNPWNKGALTVFQGQEVKLMDGMVTELQTAHPPGTIMVRGDGLYIACAGGKSIKSNMLYMHDGYLPSYHTSIYGLNHGVRLGS